MLTATVLGLVAAVGVAACAAVVRRHADHDVIEHAGASLAYGRELRGMVRERERTLVDGRPACDPLGVELNRGFRALEGLIHTMADDMYMRACRSLGLGDAEARAILLEHTPGAAEEPWSSLATRTRELALAAA